MWFEVLFGVMAIGLCAWVFVIAYGQYVKPRKPSQVVYARREPPTPIEAQRAAVRESISEAARGTVEAPKPVEASAESESERLRREAEAAGIKSVFHGQKERKPFWRS